MFMYRTLQSPAQEEKASRPKSLEVVTEKLNSVEAKVKSLKEDGHILIDQSLNKPYWATLCKVDVGTGLNYFYKIEIIHSSNIFYVYKQYGHIGTEYITHRLNQFAEEREAVDFFTGHFFKNTENQWKNSRNFVKVAGKYFQVEMDDSFEKQTHVTEQENIDWNRLNGINLDEGVKNVLAALFDVKKMEAQLKDFEVN